MRLASGMIAVAAGMLIVCVSAPVSAQTPQAISHTVAVSTGSIEGFVQDETGAPVTGAVISALGAATVYGLTDRLGHFTLRSMPPGPYFVRAHVQGFVAPRGQIVQVLAATRASSAIAVRRVGATSTTSAPVIVPASLGGLPDVPPQQDADVPSAKTSAAGNDTGKDSARDGEIEWRLRHARRSILKDAVDQAVAADAPPAPGARGVGDWSRPDVAVSSAAHIATSFFSETPFFGQVNLLTTSSFDAPLELFTTKAFASRGVANILLGAPVGDGADWTVRGALTQGDIASWLVFGDYVTRTPAARHRYDIGLSYSTQRYDGGNFAALRNVTDGSRNVGTLHGFDTFAVSPALTVTYGTRYGHYDYLDGTNLLSPRAGLVFTPVERLRVNALVSLRSLAPGAEEFMPPADTGVWLPPQRTFSSAFDGPLVAERTLHVEGGLERDIAPGATVSVRAFSQRVDNQLVTLFGLEEPGRPPATLGHYFVANSGSVAATGYAAGVKALIARRVHGSIEYSYARADRNPADALAYFLFLAPFQSVRENVHDVSTSIETEVPETSTRVAVLCRMSNGFARRDASSGSAFDARFDVQVRQALPFMDFSSAKWEMLVAVSNFFHDPSAESSIYDELLVIRPPTRVVGGLTLRF